MMQLQEPTPPHNLKLETKGINDDRGRPRSRSEDDDSKTNDHGADHAGDGANSSNSDGPSRKRRRSRKGLDKKFECPHEGCGKSYSRAEHLYRHQLNHTPKQIYVCDVGDCGRTFVRLDLCNRHKDRHNSKGSSLNRKDSLMGHLSPVAAMKPGPMPTSPELNRSGAGFNGMHVDHAHYHSPKPDMNSAYPPLANTPPTAYPNTAHANPMDYMPHDGGYGQMHAQEQSHSPTVTQRPSVQTNVGPYGVLSPVSTQHSYNSQPANTPQSGVYAQNFPGLSLPPSDFAPTPAAPVHRDSTSAYAPTTTAEYSEQSHEQNGSDMVMLDQMAMANTMPMFGPSDGVLQKSPYVVGMPDDFLSYLFSNSPQTDAGSPLGQMAAQNSYSGYGEFQPNQYGIPFYGADPSQMGYFPTTGKQAVMSVTSLLDPNLPESLLSEDKSTEIYEFIEKKFVENGHSPIEWLRAKIFDGERSDETNVLSRQMMQKYIGSYWLHFSDQVPILHKPTFSPDRMPPLLLIAMMAIGAACLDKAVGRETVKASFELSQFLAWHLRWELFMDSSFRPPAKLWVFQTLLLLELYEKMYSTRELHERAHIHHATTITLMRRGRSLLGKSALDSPPNPRGERGSSSRHSSTSGVAHTEDDWWNHWITNEATRRTAFAAFVIDSIHATMFGHSTVMVAHEMRLPLPCDESLWQASNGAEVGRIEANHASNGIKPISFLEGLKRTLSGHEVQTNSFGRTILMAGLLSVSWHMNQRDLQVNVLGGGVSHALGGRDKWRGTLTRAFDSWKADFDKTLRRGEHGTDPYYSSNSTKSAETNVVFESRMVLHHLAHMAMHVDIVDCQIFARAKRLLGRAIGTQDLNSAQRRMRDIWAPSAKARDATYYALKFLGSVLLSEDPNAGSSMGGGYGQTALPYSARDDVSLNRSWVLYFAALVVWCYGFALEGPCPAAPLATSRHEQVAQMRQYLQTYASVSSPEELKTRKGVNQNSSLLMVLRDIFQETRWELLNEGATLLGNCIQLNSGGGLG